MPTYSNREYTDMILSLGACDGNTSAAADHYRRRFPNRRHPDKRVIQRAERTLGEHGSFEKLRQRGGNRRRVSENVKEQILQDVLEHPDISAKDLSSRYNLRHSTILRILHENNIHVCHITRVQGLMTHDKISRKAFCHWLLQQHANDAEFLLKILWTHEMKFTRDGMFNIYNTHNWQDENRHSNLETHLQVRWEVNVWAGIIGHLIIGPYFYEGNVTSAAYFEFLQNKLPELLEDVPLRTRASLIFQQGDTPQHFSRHVRDFLNQHYQGWIGRAGTIAWPPHSPDLTPLNFYLWNHVKSIVYSEEIASYEQLKERIIVAFHTLKESKTLQSVHRNLIRRAELCVRQNGQHFQQFL